MHSISLFCTGEIALIIDLGLVDMFLANQTTEIVACILLTLESHNWIKSCILIGLQSEVFSVELRVENEAK